MQLRDGARVAIYARYSSTMQSPRSIQDQMALCRRRILDGAGDAEISTYADRAESATSLHDLHGLQRLLRDVGEGRIDIVCAEALDRLSRNLADLASLYERLRFEEVELVTVEEGVISPMHVGLKGLMNQDFVAVLAAKTRRGMEGAVREGRAAGGLSYGYRVVRRVDEDGQVLRGLREIDPLQAEIVRRIFRWYADGRSPRWIAGQLNAEGVPAPRGGLWKAVTINGNRSRRNGVLNNDLYHGQLLFGRTASRRDPATGRRRSRTVPPEEWTAVPVPELRIVDEDLWAVVQLRRQAGYDRRRGRGPKAVRPLTPLLRCGSCGGSLTIHSRERYTCQTRREAGWCSNNRRVPVAEVEEAAVQQLREAVRFGGDWLGDLKSAGETVAQMRAEAARDVDETRSRLRNLIEAIELGERGDGVRNRITELERDLAAGRLRVRTLDAAQREQRPARELWDRLQDRIAKLAERAGSNDPETRVQAMIRIGELLERIDISPGSEPRSARITAHPDRRALIALALVADAQTAPGAPVLQQLAGLAA